MKDVLVISTGSALVHDIQKTAKDCNMSRVKAAKFSSLADILHFVSTGLSSNIEVLVATPGPSLYLSNIAKVKIPIVAIEYDNIDIIIALRKAWALAPGAVALSHYQHENPRTADIKKILNMDFANFIFGDDDEENHKILRELHSKGINTIIGGAYICGQARELGFTAIQRRLSPITIQSALRNAIAIADTRRFARRSQNQLDIILENQAEAVVAVDQNNTITFFNRSAEKMFAVKSAQVIGRDVDEIFSGNEFAAALKSKDSIDSHPSSFRGVDVVGNYMPVFDKAKVIGAVGTFDTMRKIQKKDEYVRKFYYSKTDKAKYNFSDFYDNGPLFSQLLERARHYAGTDETILITGESGTGKEVMAGSIHNASQRRLKPFIAINCAAIPATLMESELFGYEPGSFTGGQKNARPGMFEFAHGGTLFLDEIGEMSQDMQSKLLRVLQEKEVRRIGAARSIPVDVRIIAATNRDLGNEILKDKFRSDLYYRLNVLRIQLPPLRDYTENISGIARKMLTRILPDTADSSFKKIVALLAEFKSYSWPGNLRELENVIRRFAALNSCLTRKITFQDIFDDMYTGAIMPETPTKTLPESLKPAYAAKAKLPDEYKRILDVYYRVHCNKSVAAKELGIARSTLWRKLNKINEFDHELSNLF